MSIEEKALMDIEDIAVINIENNDDVLKFELTNVNVSIANSLRRIILSEIPCVVFKTARYEESKANIEINTTRMNNELIKQRLSCIPIHIKNPNIDITVDVGCGSKNFTAYTMDLTKKYIEINADYRS